MHFYVFGPKNFTHPKAEAERNGNASPCADFSLAPARAARRTIVARAGQPIRKYVTS